MGLPLPLRLRLDRLLGPLALGLLAACGGGSGSSAPYGSTDPLPAVVALRLDPARAPALPGGPPADVPALVRAYVEAWILSSLPAGAPFPLPAGTEDEVRAVRGLAVDVVVRWLDALTPDDGPQAPRFGVNNDVTLWFGDGWDAVPGAPPAGNGSGSAGWLWVNHEFLAGAAPTTSSGATGQALTLARWMRAQGLLTNDVEAGAWSQADADLLRRRAKREVGGSWLRVERSALSGAYTHVKDPAARRWDATSATLSRVVGTALTGPDHADDGSPLPAGVVAGTAQNCAGSLTPWGTVLCGEEGSAPYGALERCWDASNAFVPGTGFDAGADVAPLASASSSSLFGALSSPDERHARDVLGWVLEADPLEPPSRWYGEAAPGAGHRKLGALGRASWESATLVTGPDGRLLEGQPLVLYAGDDRRGGRLFKFVSSGTWSRTLSRAQTRALLDAGRLFVAQVDDLDPSTGRTLTATGLAPTEAAPAHGRWIELSLASTDLAPNAAALQSSATTVGQALASGTWNGLGRFASDDVVRRCLFTACAKVGVFEWNRPEDLAWNALDPSGTPRLFVALTNNVGGSVLGPGGVLGTGAPRNDPAGAIWALSEALPGTPAASSGFTVAEVWAGTVGAGPLDAACPDNLLLDAQGGVWFATDGNVAVNGRAEGLYYLDLLPGHAATPAFGRAFRVASVPLSAEATGPSLTSDAQGLFLSVQHPAAPSTWPAGR